MHQYKAEVELPESLPLCPSSWDGQRVDPVSLHNRETKVLFQLD